VSNPDPLEALQQQSLTAFEHSAQQSLTAFEHSAQLQTLGMSNPDPLEALQQLLAAGNYDFEAYREHHDRTLATTDQLLRDIAAARGGNALRSVHSGVAASGSPAVSVVSSGRTTSSLESLSLSDDEADVLPAPPDQFADFKVKMPAHAFIMYGKGPTQVFIAPENFALGQAVTYRIALGEDSREYRRDCIEPDCLTRLEAEYESLVARHIRAFNEGCSSQNEKDPFETRWLRRVSEVVDNSADPWKELQVIINLKTPYTALVKSLRDDACVLDLRSVDDYATAERLGKICVDHLLLNMPPRPLKIGHTKFAMNKNSLADGNHPNYKGKLDDVWKGKFCPQKHPLRRLTYYSQDSNADNKYFQTAECLLLLRCGDALWPADRWQELLAELELHAQRTWLEKHGDALSGQKTINKNCPPLGNEPTEPGEIMALLYVVPFHSPAACASYKNSDKGKGKAKA